MADYTQVGKLQVATVLYDFINSQALPGTGVDGAFFGLSWIH